MRTLRPAVSAVRSLLACTALLVGFAAPISATQMLGPQVQVSVSTHTVQSNPKVGVFPDGGFVVVWATAASSGPGSRHQVLHARLFSADDTPTSGEFLLARPAAGYYVALDGVATKGNGSFAVLWEVYQTAAPGSRVFVQLFNRKGAPLTPAVLTHDPSSEDRYFGALAVAADGRIAVLWAADVGQASDQSYRNDADVRIFDSELHPLTGEMLVAMGSSVDGSGPFPDALAFGPDDTLVAALTYAGDSVDVFAQRIAADGTPLPTDQIAAGLTACPCIGGNTYDASLAMAADGSFIVTWDYGYPAQPYQLPLPLSPPSGINGRLFTAGGNALGTADIQVNRRNLGQLTSPQIASLGAGGFVAAWVEESGRDGDGNGIFARLLAEDGTPQGRDFLVNAITAGNQTAPNLTAGPRGAIIVWLSGTGTTVYARRIGIEGP
jgi:hypothetical protein